MAMQPHHQYTTIIFDLGKVIVDFDHGAVCRRLVPYCSYSPEQIFKLVFGSSFEDQFDRGLISPETFFKSISRELDLHMSMDSFREMWNTIFSLNPGIEQLIRHLAKQYQLLCLSNTNVWHYEYCLEHFPVLHVFDACIVSCAVGVRKPHKAIYQAALEKARALPQDCVYIDDIREFIQAAEKIGIRGIQFMSVPQLTQELQAMGAM